MTKDLLQGLMQSIEDDVASISVSQTSVSRYSTVYGLGTVSGRAIMAMGELALRGWENLNIRMTLRRISEQLHQRRNRIFGCTLQRVYEDLFELQRPGIYAEGIRVTALNLILFEMEELHGEELMDCLSQLKWPRIEEQLFIRHLAACKLAGWSLHPFSATHSRIPGSSLISHKNVSRSAERKACLQQSFRGILLAFLERDARSIHELFDLEEFSMLVISQEASHTGLPDQYLSRLFNSLTSWHPNPDTEIHMPCSDLPIECIIQFLSSGRRSDISAVVDHIVDAIRPFTSSNTLPQAREMLFINHPCLKTSNIIHPLWPFIYFAAKMCRESVYSTGLFLKFGLLEMIEYLWIHGFPESGRDSTEMRVETCNGMRMGCLMVLGALARHSDDLAERLYKSKDPAWFIDADFNVFIGRLKSPRPGGFRQGFYLPLARLSLTAMEHCLTHPRSYAFPQGPYEYILSLLSYVMFSQIPIYQLGQVTYTYRELPEKTDGRRLKEQAARILFHSAAMEEDRWAPLIGALTSAVKFTQVASLSYFFKRYLRCFESDRQDPSDPIIRSLQEISSGARTRGLDVTNPVERFITMCMNAAEASESLTQACSEVNMVGVLIEVSRGRYHLGAAVLCDIEENEKNADSIIRI